MFNPTALSSHHFSDDLGIYRLPEKARISSFVYRSRGGNLWGALDRPFYKLMHMHREGDNSLRFVRDVEDMPIPLSSPCLVADNKNVYVLGGLYGNNISSKITMRYNVAKDTWKFGYSMTYGHVGGGCILVRRHNWIYAFGGRGYFDESHTLHGFIDYAHTKHLFTFPEDPRLVWGDNPFQWDANPSLPKPFLYDFQSIYIELFGRKNDYEPIEMIFIVGGKDSNGKKSRRTYFIHLDDLWNIREGPELNYARSGSLIVGISLRNYMLLIFVLGGNDDMFDDDGYGYAEKMAISYRI